MQSISFSDKATPVLHFFLVQTGVTKLFF